MKTAIPDGVFSAHQNEANDGSVHGFVERQRGEEDDAERRNSFFLCVLCVLVSLGVAFPA